MPAGAAPPTVHSLHTLAEHVLGAGLYGVTGHIGLQIVPGGFGTPDSARDAVGGQWSIVDGQLVSESTDGIRSEAPIVTVAAAAEFFGVTPGMPSSVYQPATELDLDAELPVDLSVAAEIGHWLQLGDLALVRFAADHADEEPTGRTLWPEHFDLGLGMSEVNYGVSPGDAEHAEPYLYVGPWTPRTGPFWSEPFGASAAASTIATVEAALAFFEQGRALAAAEETSP